MKMDDDSKVIFKKLEVQGLLVAFVLGGGLLLAALYLDKHYRFTPIYLVSGMKEWLIGHREVAHLIGMSGGVLFSWYFLSSFAHRSLIIFNAAATLVIAALVIFEFPYQGWSFDLFGMTAFEIGVNGTPLIFGVWALLSLIAYQTPNLLRPWPSLAAICAAFLVNVAYWEVCHQPFESVYGEAPRGWIEYGQVCFDIVGVMAGAGAVAVIASALKKMKAGLGKDKASTVIANSSGI